VSSQHSAGLRSNTEVLPGDEGEIAPEAEKLHLGSRIEVERVYRFNSRAISLRPVIPSTTTVLSCGVCMLRPTPDFSSALSQTSRAYCRIYSTMFSPPPARFNAAFDQFPALPATLLYDCPHHLGGVGGRRSSHSKGMTSQERVTNNPIGWLLRSMRPEHRSLNMDCVDLITGAGFHA
jgi:hypothetical protein